MVMLQKCNMNIKENVWEVMILFCVCFKKNTVYEEDYMVGNLFTQL